MPVIAYKNKEFHRWAKKENLSDALLLAALDEMERGLVEADLGGNVLKNAFLWGKERVVALEPYWLTRKMIEPFLYLGLQKIREPTLKRMNLGH